MPYFCGIRSVPVAWLVCRSLAECELQCRGWQSTWFAVSDAELYRSKQTWLWWLTVAPFIPFFCRSDSARSGFSFKGIKDYLECYR